LPYVVSDRTSPFPLILFIEVTKKCNLRCAQCDVWKIGRLQAPEGAHDLTLHEIQAIAAEGARHGSVIAQFYGGEPLIRPDLDDMIRAFRDRGIAVGVTTNGSLLTPTRIDALVTAGLSRLIVSLDHFIPEEHDRLRGRPGLFEHVVNSLRYAIATYSPSPLQLEVNTVIHRGNFRDLVRMSTFLADLGIRTHNVHPIMRYYPLKMGAISEDARDDLYFRSEDLSALEVEIDRFYTHLRRAGITTTTTHSVLQAAVRFYAGRHRRYICAVGAVSCDIFADGQVGYCAGSEVSIGNIREHPLYEIWHSERAARVKKALSQCCRCVDSCQADLRLRFSPGYALRNLGSLVREAFRILG
jgi:MoaA/NifB/PqqE/SkfB family radical SAM enzyme